MRVRVNIQRFCLSVFFCIAFCGGEKRATGGVYLSWIIEAISRSWAAGVMDCDSQTVF